MIVSPRCKAAPDLELKCFVMCTSEKGQELNIPQFDMS